ncbi:MAG: hypothetical protein NT007_05355 [Candidatus Kapabacteria bacterium]|nr:hypothetical protein [Candidatus Kapabacteria bacterium]
MRFPRMQESHSSTNQGIPAFAQMTRKGSFHTVSCAQMTALFLPSDILSNVFPFLPFCILHSAFCILHSAFCILNVSQNH